MDACRTFVWENPSHLDRAGLQEPVAAHRYPQKSDGKELICRMINSIRKGLPADLEELAQLDRTL